MLEKLSFERLAVCRFMLGCAALLAASCNITPPEGVLRCQSDVQCPTDWSCVDSLCYAEATALPNLLLGEACGVVLDKTCSGDGLRDKLVCLQGHWQFNGTCDGVTRCDMREGSTHGTCQPLAPLCAAAESDLSFCEFGERKRCSADQLSYELEACPENTHCEGTAAASCVCDPGYVPDAAGGCRKDECPAGFVRTEQEACDDVDECAGDAGPCGAHRACQNSHGSFECGACDAGYELTGDRCVDIDECAQGTSQCGEHRACMNLVGSYDCGDCESGYVPQDAECVELDECAAGSCGPQRACSNTPGGYLCGDCLPGFQDQAGACVDIDECAALACGLHRECVNVVGSYSCAACQSGYELSGEVCLDIDECTSTAEICGANRGCVNADGAYVCGDCYAGFQADLSGACTDIDECATNNGDCGVHRECTNTQGSRSCGACQSGYQDVDGACTDINECLVQPDICGDGRCVNVDGSYSCRIIIDDPCLTKPGIPCR